MEWHLGLDLRVVRGAARAGVYEHLFWVYYKYEGGWQLARAEKGHMLAIAPTPTFRTWKRAPDPVVG